MTWDKWLSAVIFLLALLVALAVIWTAFFSKKRVHGTEKLFWFAMALALGLICAKNFSAFILALRILFAYPGWGIDPAGP